MLRRVLIAVAVLFGTFGCTTQEQRDRDRRAMVEEHEAELEATTGKFPEVTVGMRYSELLRMVKEMNPPHTGETHISNIGMDIVSGVGDLKTIRFSVSKGLYRNEYVFVTVRDDVIVSWSRY